MLWETEPFKYSHILLVLEVVIPDTAHNYLERSWISQRQK